jgi:hypothetical protein
MHEDEFLDFKDKDGSKYGPGHPDPIEEWNSKSPECSSSSYVLYNVEMPTLKSSKCLKGSKSFTDLYLGEKHSFVFPKFFSLCMSYEINQVIQISYHSLLGLRCEFSFMLKVIFRSPFTTQQSDKTHLYHS